MDAHITQHGNRARAKRTFRERAAVVRTEEKEHESKWWYVPRKEEPLPPPTMTHEESVAFWAERVRAYKAHIKQFENQSENQDGS